MIVSRYRPILYLQYLLLLVDIVLNCIIDLVRFQNVILLILYVAQDVCIVFALFVIFLLFFNTYIFQAGLVSILVNKFKTSIVLTFVYLGLNIGLHVWTMFTPDEDNTLRWHDPMAYIWTNGLIALYVIQRIAAVSYYYFYKRTALRLADPRFYEDSAWLRKEFGKRR